MCQCHAILAIPTASILVINTWQLRKHDRAGARDAYGTNTNYTK
jgi:hypothetical protein